MTDAEVIAAIKHTMGVDAVIHPHGPAGPDRPEGFARALGGDAVYFRDADGTPRRAVLSRLVTPEMIPAEPQAGSGA